MISLPEIIVPDWPVPNCVRAISTTRQGGISESPYQSLNFSDRVGDNSNHVFANRKHLLKNFNVPDEPVWLHQVHGASAIRAGKSVTGQSADAGFTNEKGVVCAVLTADCLPILLADSLGECVAAIHGGWRGLLAGIIENTIRHFERRNPVAWLGPAIGPDKFEVGDDVRDQFVAKNEVFARVFQISDHDSSKWFADIFEIARIILLACGVDEIHGGGVCTYSDHNRFFSYRRDQTTGRMATMIWLQ